MRNRSLSDLILAITLGLCVAAVAGERRQQTEVDHAVAAASANHNVADGARALARAVLLDGSANEGSTKPRHAGDESADTADAALDRAAEAAGRAAAGVEMPFISFGSATE